MPDFRNCLRQRDREREREREREERERGTTFHLKERENASDGKTKFDKNCEFHTFMQTSSFFSGKSLNGQAKEMKRVLKENR